MASKAYTLNTTDLKNQARSALIFLGPSIVAFLTVLIPAVDKIVPTTTDKLILITVIKWGLDQLLGLLTKFLAGKK